MPRIYTRDLVGEMIEDEYLGNLGIATGSYINALALERRRAEQQRKEDDAARARAQAAQDAAERAAAAPYFPPVKSKPAAEPDPVIKAVTEFFGGLFVLLFMIVFVLQVLGFID